MLLQLPAKLNIADARAAVPALVAQAREGGGPLEVDASPLSDFDSSAIATLLELRRIATAAGRAFSVRGVPQSMAELAALYGVAALLGFEPLATGG